MPQPGQTTIALADLRADIRSRTDTENDPHISDVDLNRWAWAGYGDLYDQLITMFGDDYFMATSAQITTDGQTQLYPLPADFYKLFLCELQNSMGASLNNSVPAWLTMQPFQLREKNKYNLINFASYLGYLNIRYRLNGSNIMFAPLPQGGQVVRLWYAPRLVPLADTGYVQLKGVVAGDTLTINGVAFAAVASGATGTQFNVGATDTATATNLAAAILAANIPGIIAVTAGPTNSPAAGGNGNVIPANPNLPGNFITITIYNAVVTWSASSAHLTMAPGPQGALASNPGVSPVTYTWSDVLDAVSSWWELVAVDAGLKVIGKQERDPSLLVAQKAEIKARLDRAAPNRNIADPATVAETQGDYPFPGTGLGWPGGSWF